ncbi:hypothetical protein UK15_07855 [Streptomyces variegatus]|uniref:Uncharacterized protein n=1 Tax=Streptomyces variegatus TaxID=284040 RepID=A0A0M2GX78_9ACTN|nr:MULTISPECIES: hypothetical protein [Streptomyces]KJK40253.1 hypothetical protein UK15_07855 [Streptomyces variegatus]
MAVVVRLTGPADVAEIVEALVAAAEAKETDAPELALRWRWLANDIGDALDQLPAPTTAEDDQ